MQEITVFFDESVGIDAIHTHGEVLFDASENSLIVQGTGGAYINFNWTKVTYYAVSPLTDTEGNPANV